MMPLPLAANDASPLTLRNDAARFARNDAMLAHMCRRHTSLAKRHHCRRQHHLPDRANIIEKRLASASLFSWLLSQMKNQEGIRMDVFLIWHAWRDSNLVVACCVSFASAPCFPFSREVSFTPPLLLSPKSLLTFRGPLFSGSGVLIQMNNQEGIRMDVFLIWHAWRDSNPRPTA